MAKYTTKPFTIEAVQWKPKKIYLDLLNAEFGDDAGFDFQHDTDALGKIVNARVYDYLQDVFVPVNDGDYIIKGMKGEYYPCDPEVFEAKYDLVTLPDFTLTGTLEYRDGEVTTEGFDVHVKDNE